MAGQTRIDRRTTVTFHGPMTVDDLRDFMREIEQVPGDARVQVTHYAGDQRDGSATTITVHGAGA